jgi:hypothetical protein
MKKLIYSLLAFFLISMKGFGQKAENSHKIVTDIKLSNAISDLQVHFDNGVIASEKLTGKGEWLSKYGNTKEVGIETDGDFCLHIMWTDWRPPGKDNNADNLVSLRKSAFLIQKSETRQLSDGSTLAEAWFSAAESTMELRVSYLLGKTDFYYKRKIAIRDTAEGTNFLREISAMDAAILNTAKPNILKNGGFGQPVALVFNTYGGFMALEYPAATNTCTTDLYGATRVNCSQEFGVKIASDWVESEWVVAALVPVPYVKDWFFNYLDAVRVQPAKPYTLYNSWYDLRSPEYPKVKPENVMNEANVGKIIDLFKTNMIDKHNIHLDAFVLDDGWDVYESDWKLRPETFPNGMKPVADRLKGIGSNLGIWFGPTGGYSFRMKRVNWMKAHGYEVVGKTRDYAMLCLGGKNYSSLFEKRTTDFVKNDGVAYFKWDGIQFSCSEADHGHAVGQFSRRAVMESVISKCRAVRAINPNTYLNITSGTWLSPWWTKYANQIWMDGQDFGFSDVPCIHERDASITYKDYVLYEDFTRKDLWFPISNLMTHGIIKGNLETVGGDNDPIDKFTNDAAFYFARGVSMWELYISPDLLNPAEWDAMSTAISWARANWDVLSKTFMVGGDPGKAESYAYLHYKGNQGIIAARNPNFGPSEISITLDPGMGLDPMAANLVLERIYPNRWVSPDLYAAGAKIVLPLDAYETAIYELKPLDSVREPLYAGLVFHAEIDKNGDYLMHCLGKQGNPRLLNPEIVQRITFEKGAADLEHMNLPEIDQPKLFAMLSKSVENVISFETASEIGKSLVSVLEQPAEDLRGKDIPAINILLDGKAVKAAKEEQKGYWSWHSFEAGPGNHSLAVAQNKDEKTKNWKGNQQVWLAADFVYKPKTVRFTMKQKPPARPLPSLPYPANVMRYHFQMNSKNIQ